VVKNGLPALSDNTLQKTYVQTFQASFAAGTLYAIAGPLGFKVKRGVKYDN